MVWAPSRECGDEAPQWGHRLEIHFTRDAHADEVQDLESSSRPTSCSKGSLLSSVLSNRRGGAQAGGCCHLRDVTSVNFGWARVEMPHNGSILCACSGCSSSEDVLELEHTTDWVAWQFRCWATGVMAIASTTVLDSGVLRPEGGGVIPSACSGLVLCAIVSPP